jgi:hypothetical protein
LDIAGLDTPAGVEEGRGKRFTIVTIENAFREREPITYARSSSPPFGTCGTNGGEEERA